MIERYRANSSRASLAAVLDPAYLPSYNPRVVLCRTLVLLSMAGRIVTTSAAVDGLRCLGSNTVNRNHLMDCEISGVRAFLAVGVNNGIEQYDISDPGRPVRTFAGGPNCWRLRQYADTLLLAFCRREGVVLCDIRGATPSQLGRYDPPGATEALEGGALVGTTLYAAAHQNGVYVIDVSNPAAPQKTGALLLDSNAVWNIESRDSFLFCANGRFGLAVVGLEGGPHPVACLSLPGLANDIVLDGNVAVLSLGASGLATVDVSNPGRPSLLDTTTSDGCAWGIGARGHSVIVGAWTGLELVDVTDPTRIQKTGWDHTPTFAHGADIRTDSLIVNADWRGMYCYRIGNDALGDIEVSPRILDFGAVAGQRETTVVVRNTGAGPLNVSSVTAPSGIAANPTAFGVLPGDSQLVRVTATGPSPVSGVLSYRSDDPDETTMTQEVYKNNTAFPQTGSPAPDFTLPGYDGRAYSLSDFRGRVVYLEFGASW
jgi:hypothetical protein